MGGLRAIAMSVFVIGGCAEGTEATTFGQPAKNSGGGDTGATDDDGETAIKEEEGDDEGQPGGDESGPDFGACMSEADCFSPAVMCFVAQGQCVDGMCKHDPRPAGSPCDDGDACTEDDVCDGTGACFGNDIDCTAPNAGGGTCNAGMCQGLSCAAGFGDCNRDMSDGCETSLATASDCGECGQSCSAGAHASADCSTGTCARSCQSPWDNCDGDWGNGCEIPVGVPNQCNANGLNAGSGCWTAYCGNSNSTKAVNFGTYHCIDCVNCHHPSATTWQWCNHTSGNWYPAAAEGGSCGAYEDVVCTP